MTHNIARHALIKPCGLTIYASMYNQCLHLRLCIITSNFASHYTIHFCKCKGSQRPPSCVWMYKYFFLEWNLCEIGFATWLQSARALGGLFAPLPAPTWVTRAGGPLRARKPWNVLRGELGGCSSTVSTWRWHFVGFRQILKSEAPRGVRLDLGGTQPWEMGRPKRTKEQSLSAMTTRFDGQPGAGYNENDDAGAQGWVWQRHKCSRPPRAARRRGRVQQVNFLPPFLAAIVNLLWDFIFEGKVGHLWESKTYFHCCKKKHKVACHCTFG